MEQEGNLLESVTADAALANEWSLPVLPEGNSSHPSSSQELADIFGTSDDEEDMDFPFGLSTNLPVPKGFEDITLPDEGNKPFGNSLLSNSDSELFLAGFERTPEKEKNVAKVSPQKQSEKKKEENTDPPSEPQEEKMEADETQESEQSASQSATEDTDDPSQDSAKTTSDQDTTSEAEAPPKNETTSVVRKSARLRARQSAPESSGSSSEQEPPPVEKEPPEKPDTVKEEPQNKEEESENRKSSPPEQESKSSSESSSEDEDSEEEDPNKLYCICRQPHDDRFMICCDICEDWFHGNCVGITVAQGKRMEREGKEYVCPICVEKHMKFKEEAAANRTARQHQREVTRENVIKKKLAAAHGTTEPHTPTKRRRTLSSSTPTDADSYGLSQLFLPDNAPKGSEVTSTSEEKPSSNELLVYKCMIPDCPNKTTPPSVYCSKQCIEKHVSNSLEKLASQGVNLSSNPKEFVKGSGGITVVEKATKKIMVGICAPSEKELVPWLQAHPSYQVFIHSKGKKSKLKSTKVKPEVKKEEVKYPKIALMDPDSVRANAKKALYQILWKRCEEASDMSEVPQSEVESIAHDIEEKLYNLNQDINPKYKNKYRSLIFNLKDMKNQGLFRKVLQKEVSSKELVRMSSEKLASEELAAWRESTLKKDLEMIKQREEEVGALGEIIRKVTHKGEVELDSTEIGEKIVENVTAPAAAESAEVEPNKLDTKSHSKPKLKSESKTPDSSKGGILALLTNTTSDHGKHLYDHHCDICTGKMKPPTPSNSPPPSPDSRMHEDMETETTEPVEHPSPDSVAKPLSHPPHTDANKVIWNGSVSMIGLTKFASKGYTVSGYTDDLYEHLPHSMELIGRIAYAQVWDYLDKIKSSGTKDIVVIRFDWLEDEKDPYLSMFNYLVRKHRSGVIISGGPDTIKDMYLVPLPGHWDVPQQLLPFSGPGLPVDRGDMMLGVIVRSKARRPSHHQLNHPSPVTRIRAEVTLKRHHSLSDDSMPENSHRKRSKIEVGFGGQTPPSSSKPRAETSVVKTEDDDDTPYSPSNMFEDTSLDDLSVSNSSKSDAVKKEEPQAVQMSFYGEHQPAGTDTSTSLPSTTLAEETSKPKPSNINTSAVADSLRTALNLPPTANIQNILANLSSSKLKELASAVSSLEKISDGPIDQSTLAAAGTAKLRAALGSESSAPSNSSTQPAPASLSVPPVVPPAISREPSLASESMQSQQHPPQQPGFPPQPAQGPHPHQSHEAHHHQAQGPPPPQFRTEWDQRHQQQSYRTEPPPPPPQQQQQQQQYNHPPQDKVQHPPANYPPEQHEYHRPPNQRDNPPQQSYPPQPPPANGDPSYHPPHGHYPPHEWRDPRTNWGQQQQHYQQEPPHNEGWNRDEMFHSRGRGFRGGFRGRGGPPERRGTWDNERYSEHGDRYRH